MRGLTNTEYETLSMYIIHSVHPPAGYRHPTGLVSDGTNRWTHEMGPVTGALISRGLVIVSVYQFAWRDYANAILTVTPLGHLALACHRAVQSLGSVCPI